MYAANLRRVLAADGGPALTKLGPAYVLTVEPASYDDAEADPFTIGAYVQGGTNTPAGFLAGRVDELALFHRALSPQSLLVLDPSADLPKVKLFNWQTGVREAASTNSRTVCASPVAITKSSARSCCSIRHMASTYSGA